MANIEKILELLCIATKDIKENQIKDELQLVSMNETINFNSEKCDEFEKDRPKKGKVIKHFFKKSVWNDPEDWQVREFSRPTRTIFLAQLSFSAWNRKKNYENTDDLVLKTINEKQVDITENKIDRSHKISAKKDGRDED